MPSMLDDYRKMMLWQNIGRIGQGLLMAGAQGRPLGQGLAMGMANMQPMPGLSDLYKIEESQRKAEQEKQQGTALSKLFGGRDPQTGITWNQGRPGLLGKPQGLGLMAQAYPEKAASAYFESMKPKDPLIRDFKAGDEFVTKRYNRDTGQWEEMGRAPRYKPGVDVNVEAPDLSGMTEYLTKTQRGQEVQGLREQQIQSVQMVKQGSSLIGDLRSAGDQAVSWSGTMARGLDTLVSQGNAIAKNFGIRFADGSIGKSLSVDDWNWGPLASEASIIKSKILGLAVAITKADQGSRPSDFDVQTSITRIAGNAGSANRTADVVESLLREKMGDFSVRYNTLAPDYGLKPFAWEEELKRQNIDFPASSKQTYTTEELLNMSDEEIKKLLGLE
jgi:hypothetical protein